MVCSRSSPQTAIVILSRRGRRTETAMCDVAPPGGLADGHDNKIDAMSRDEGDADKFAGDDE